MAWTDPTQRSTGDLITQSVWNTDIVDNLAYLLAAVEPDTLTNRSGGTLTAGAVVIADTSNDNSFTTTTAADNGLVIGVVMESIANAAAGRVAAVGVATVNVQGNVARGNYLSTSTTAGRAKDAGSSKAAGTFAIALTAYSGGGAGTVTALILPAMSAGAIPSNAVHYTSAGAAPAGYTEYAAARGRVIVGLPSAGTNTGTVGSALTDQQNPTHTHTYTMPSHSHTFAYGGGSPGSGGIAINSSSVLTNTPSTSTTGGTATTDTANTVMPYIQLMGVQKD
jgi:hypothetical protein